MKSSKITDENGKVERYQGREQKNAGRMKKAEEWEGVPKGIERDLGVIGGRRGVRHKQEKG